jgi:hypothetical protein
MEDVVDFKRLVIALSFLSLFVSILPPAYGQSGGGRQTQGMLPKSSFPPASLPQNGGRLGVEVDTNIYVFEGRTVLKVVRVLPRSGLLGQIEANDYIYNINGFDVGSPGDLFRVVQSGAPGTNVRVSYLSARHGLRPFITTVRLYGADGVPETGNNSTTAQSGGEEEFFCTRGVWQAAACLAGTWLLLDSLFGSPTAPAQDRNGSARTERRPCPPNYYLSVSGGCKCGLERGCP